MWNQENGELHQVLCEQARVSARLEEMDRRQQEMERLMDSVHRLATSVELLAASQKQTEKKVDALCRDVGQIRERPGKKWDSAASTLLTAAVSGLAAYALARMGLK